MARARTNSDIFNALAEKQRRKILDVLITRESTVNQLSEKLDISQPQTSKHLRILRDVDLVHTQKHGKQRIYRLNEEALKPMIEWLTPFERLLKARYDRLDNYLEQLQNGGTKND